MSNKPPGFIRLQRCWIRLFNANIVLMPCNYLRLNKGSKKKEYFSLIYEKRRFSKLTEKYFDII